ncbi:MAG: amidohydrolase family protein [Solirubrobacteraceae bacterium]|nr:amidohydrolase family protein [Solirubrobacteraceae bacterium]
MSTDLHQHLFTDSLVAALVRRASPPRLRRVDTDWVLAVPGEPRFVLQVPDDPEIRLAQADAQGIDRIVIAPSSPLGIEALPPDRARELIDAYDHGVDELGPRFSAWGTVPLREIDPEDVDVALRRGRVGLCLPSGALETLAGLDRLGPVLERLASRGAPLFVHPGPEPWRTPARPTTGPYTRAWWPAMVDYTASLNAAWHAWMAAGREQHPSLRVVFAALAGGAPLHLERLAQRAGPGIAKSAAEDPHVFYETSSYGPLALAAVAGAVGAQQLIFGSDAPYADAYIPEGARGRELTTDNPARLFARAAVKQEIHA